MYNFNKAAEPLARVDSLAISEKLGDVLIKAEYGCGKTYSLLPIAPRSLYLAHRTSLIKQNQHFAKAVTINGLGYVKNINDYEYLIIDELLGVFAGLSWDQVPFSLVYQQLQEFSGKIIAIDRDASHRTAQLLGGLTGRPIAYHHHLTGSRNKNVAFTGHLNRLIKLAKTVSGIRLILCDSKRQVEQLYQLQLDSPKYKITGEDGVKALSILEKAELEEDCWVFASPVIQEGVSLDSPKYVFSGYIHGGTKGMVTPVSRGMQALHRVRNPSAIRAVCLTALDYVFPDERDIQLTEDELLNHVRGKYVESTNQTIDFVNWHYRNPREDFFTGHKAIGLEIYSHLFYATQQQKNNLITTWNDELEASGYAVICPDFDSEKASGLVYTEQADLGFPPFANLYTDSDREELLKSSLDADFIRKYDIDETNLLQFNRVSALRYFGVDRANDSEFIAGYQAKGHYFRIAKIRKLLFNETFGVRGSLFEEINNTCDFLVRKLLITTFGAEWLFLGTPRLKPFFAIKKVELYSNPIFQQLKSLEMGDNSSQRETWFWKLLRDRYGLNSEPCGKSNSEQRIANDIDFNHEVVQIKQLIATYNLRELALAYAVERKLTSNQQNSN